MFSNWSLSTDPFARATNATTSTAVGNRQYQ